MRYVLGETLQEYQEEIMEKDRPSVFLATSQTARDCLEQAGMQYEGEINLKDVGFCKMETQQECLAGSGYSGRTIQDLIFYQPSSYRDCGR